MSAFALVVDGQVVDRRDVPETKIETDARQAVDSNGRARVDDDGNPIMESIQRQVVVGDWRPVVIERDLVDLETHNETVATIIEPDRVRYVYTATPRPPTAAEVRLEASRRMQALVGARDAAHLEQIITNGLREAARLQQRMLERLLDPAAPALTAGETLRRLELTQIDAAIEAIRAASNELEPAPPADYADDRHWPKGT